MQAVKQAGASAAEIARFNALAARWWDPEGPMRALHQMNPVRVGWIAERIGRRFGPGPQRILDVGCGAGLAAEALARRGHEVLGIDAAEALIELARRHAAPLGLPLSYRLGVAEDLFAEATRFPVITALEVIEHVPEPASFLRTLAGLLEPGGVLFLSTLNRTTLSFLTAKIGAEYVLRWLPPGTHDWRKFITPRELGALTRGAGLLVSDIAGLTFEPIGRRWRTSHDTSINYIIEAKAA
jgi:2-polyprenyl-6-hydroxyphenyl methylase/3-demethylubiquinone-9 3-methyltransferase